MPKLKPRQAVIKDGVALIPIGHKAKDGYAIVDVSDAWIAEYHWCLSHGRAMTKSTGNSIFMHRCLLGYTGKHVIDHIDGNPLNNRKSNLRITTQKKNIHNSITRSDNTSGHRGVTWAKSHKKWQVTVASKYVGRFKTYDEAVRARINAEIKEYGYRIMPLIPR